MTTARALKTLESRHAHLCDLIQTVKDGRVNFYLAEAAALEFAMDCVMKQSIAARTCRNARIVATARSEGVMLTWWWGKGGCWLRVFGWGFSAVNHNMPLSNNYPYRKELVKIGKWRVFFLRGGKPC